MTELSTVPSFHSLIYNFAFLGPVISRQKQHWHKQAILRPFFHCQRKFIHTKTNMESMETSVTPNMAAMQGTEDVPNDPGYGSYKIAVFLPSD